MNFDLTDEQELLAGSVRSFVERELFPHEDEVERSGSVPATLAAEIREKAAAAGLVSANMPRGFGGGGLTHFEMALVERELGKTSFALHDLVPRPSRILLACEGDQIDRYLKPCISGATSECFALTEAGAGSDVYAIATHAVRDGDAWVMDGSKIFISGGEQADFAIVFAVTGTDRSERGERTRISAFLVDRGPRGSR